MTRIMVRTSQIILIEVLTIMNFILTTTTAEARIPIHGEMGKREEIEDG